MPTRQGSAPPRNSEVMNKETRRNFIPVNRPLLEGNELAYLKECIETGWISSEGPFVKRFEEELSARVGRDFGIAVSSGTAALDIAVAALGIGPGEEVILPAFTIISCAQAVVRAGATPVLVDCDPRTWNMATSSIPERITSRTKAILAVHTYGLPVDMDEVTAIAEEHDLLVIEDAAEAIGQTYQGRDCGSFGDISAFSFYPNKHITTGEGGMLLTDNEELAEKCRDLRNLCFGRKRRFVHHELGWNYRMSNLQAAVGVAQLERLDIAVERKREIGRSYNELLTGVPNLQLPLASTDYAENIYWVYGIVLGDEIRLDAEQAMERLAERGIGTRPFFWPMHEQPVFKRMGYFSGEKYATAERLARRGFYIPSGLGITDEEIQQVAEAVKEVVS